MRSVLESLVESAEQGAFGEAFETCARDCDCTVCEARAALAKGGGVMLKYPSYDGEAVCQLFVGFEGRPESGANVADLIACLKANPEACAEVLIGVGVDRMREATEYYSLRRAKEAEARAEKAERERDEYKVRAQRAGHAEVVALNERDAALARLASAENERNALRSALTDSQPAILDSLRSELEECRAKLAETTEALHLANRDVDRLNLACEKANEWRASAERVVEAAQMWSTGTMIGHSALHAALRAHDSSGDPTHAPFARYVATPEPAGTTPDPQAPATLADLAKLREEIAEAAVKASRPRYSNDCNTHSMLRLADELRKGGAE